MLWKRTTPNHRYEFVAVNRVRDITDEDKSLYGQRTFRLELADGTQEEITLEADKWRQWQESVFKGGLVINPNGA